MKKFLFNILGFIFFLIPFYIILLLLWGTFLPPSFLLNLIYKEGSIGFMQTRLREADTTKNVDILCLGSSHCYRGFDPRLFKLYGYRMFNLGSSSQTPLETDYLLNKYLHQFKPKLVLFDVYPAVFQSDGVESLIDVLSNEPPDKRTLPLCIEVNSIRGYNTLIYSCYKHFFRRNGNIEKKVKADGDTYINGGFVESYKKYNPKKVSSVTYDFADKQFRGFKRIIKTLQDNRTNYIIVQTPITQDRYNAVTNNNSVDSLFRSYGPYYNFNKVARLNDSCFYDNHHLNQYGVNIYNKELLQVLQNDKKLPIKL